MYERSGVGVISDKRTLPQQVPFVGGEICMECIHFRVNLPSIPLFWTPKCTPIIFSQGCYEPQDEAPLFGFLTPGPLELN